MLAPQGAELGVFAVPVNHGASHTFGNGRKRRFGSGAVTAARRPGFALAPARLAAVLAGCPCLKLVFGEMLRDAWRTIYLITALAADLAVLIRAPEESGWRE